MPGAARAHCYELRGRRVGLEVDRLADDPLPALDAEAHRRPLGAQVRLRGEVAVDVGVLAAHLDLHPGVRRDDVPALACVELSVHARHALLVARQGHDVDRGVRGGEKRVAARLRMRARVGRPSDELEVDLRRREELRGLGHDHAELELRGDVPAKEHVDALENPGLQDGVRAPRALLGRLADDEDPPGEAVRVRADEARDAHDHRLVAVMAAGVHDAVPDRREPLAKRLVRDALGLLDGEGVELDADRHRAARAPRVPLGDEPRIVPHAADLLDRHAVLLGEEPPALDLRGIAPAHELRGDELRPVGELETRVAEDLRKAGRGDELRPARLGNAVDLAARGDELLGRDRIGPARIERSAPRRLLDGRGGLRGRCG